jgi:hypothetical protein
MSPLYERIIELNKQIVLIDEALKSKIPLSRKNALIKQKVVLANRISNLMLKAHLSLKGKCLSVVLRNINTGAIYARLFSDVMIEDLKFIHSYSSHGPYVIVDALTIDLPIDLIQLNEKVEKQINNIWKSYQKQ